MTYQTHPRNALEAVLAASRASSGVPHAAPARLEERLPNRKVSVERAAVALLARVLAYRPAQGPPIIQLAGCAPSDRPLSVAASLAQACAVLVGRTLMLGLDRQESGLLMPPSTAGPLPDAFLARLYHYRIGTGVADNEMLYGAMRAESLAALVTPFRIVVVDTPGPCSGAAVALAALCSCTVLVVQAGQTQLSSVRSAVASIEQAGGKLVGTVLAENVGFD